LGGPDRGGQGAAGLSAVGRAGHLGFDALTPARRSRKYLCARRVAMSCPPCPTISSMASTQHRICARIWHRAGGGAKCERGRARRPPPARRGSHPAAAAAAAAAGLAMGPHRRFRNGGTDSIHKSGTKRMSGGEPRRCGRALPGGPGGGGPGAAHFLSQFAVVNDPVAFATHAAPAQL
jgi:hypothetical protein